MTYSEIMRHTGITEEWKVKLSDTVGEVDFRLTQGARPEIQLSTLLAHLTLSGEKMK
jgi:DNA polymerase III delta prime subunit